MKPNVTIYYMLGPHAVTRELHMDAGQRAELVTLLEMLKTAEIGAFFGTSDGEQWKQAHPETKVPNIVPVKHKLGVLWLSPMNIAMVDFPDDGQ